MERATRHQLRKKQDSYYHISVALLYGHYGRWYDRKLLHFNVVDDFHTEFGNVENPAELLVKASRTAVRCAMFR